AGGGWKAALDPADCIKKQVWKDDLLD
ncbi:hypothetical protein A2U01_0119494, partial [Trifolium medium]|nr:hypothetical protein [Trifolium medium]